MATQLDKAKDLLRPLHAAVKACDTASLDDLLARNRRHAARPDPSIDRETWARLNKALALTVDLRGVLNALSLDE